MWPPTLADLKDDLAIPPEDDEDDAALQRRLDAAIGFVQRARKDAFVTDEDGNLVLPPVLESDSEEQTLVLGAIMFAKRLFARRRSDDQILFMAETGTTRVPAAIADEDLNRLLRLGRFARPKVG